MNQPLPDRGKGSATETPTLLSSARELLKRANELVDKTTQIKLRLRHEPMAPPSAETPKEVLSPSLQQQLNDLSRALSQVEENTLTIQNTIGE